MSYDATFRLPGRTPECDGNAAVFLMGEDHCVCGWWVLGGENWEEMMPGMLRLRTRLEHMQVPDPQHSGETMRALDLLRYLYDDRCCNGQSCSLQWYVGR